jgi:L-alanine-DL-glutamate epimerase-like enolase superfamily enzyme
MDATRAAEIEARIEWRGAHATGLGEAACLPPVTSEDQDDVLREVQRAAGALVDRSIDANDALQEALAGTLGGTPVARAGVETALLDAMARIAGVPLRSLLGGDRGQRTSALETDITLPIAEPAKMAQLARRWWRRGFRTLKVKVGKDIDADARALEAIGRAVPRARIRVDANAGYKARDAIVLARACDRLGLAVECWEQPCEANDLDGMAEVASALEAPVIADESLRRPDDLREILRRRCADGVNLKLAKLGGVLAAYATGLDAQQNGLKVMFGGMVETRLGMTAAAHTACALGGVDFVDLDTAWLLEEDPYEGGYLAVGPHYSIPDTPGLALRRRDRPVKTPEPR